MDTNKHPLKTSNKTDIAGIKLVEEDIMKPRRLTEEEIKDILDIIPEVKSASIQVGEFNRLSLLKTIREQLKEIMITPLGINDMKDEILRQFNKSVIKHGSVVGVTAAEALGGPITQMALNSFHQSGSAKNVTFGVSRVRELINATKELKNVSCSIFFENQHMSFDDIISKVRPEITDISVSDVVKGIPDIETIDNIEEPQWYQTYRMLIRDDFKANAILDLDIDVNILYAYKITMEDICRVIEQNQPVICVYSPLNIGKIHIYPIEKSIASKIKSEGIIDRKNASMVFLWKIVIPALDKLKIKGISGITQIYPVEAPVWQIVKDEMKASSVDRGWFLILNEVRMKITGISVSKLVYLCKTVGMTVPKVRNNYILVQTPVGESPTTMVIDLIKADKQAEKEYESNKRSEGAIIIRRPPTKIMNASFIVYADSDGSIFKKDKSTLRTLLAHPNIDSTRTYCNNVHEMNAVLGIEAARTFLIKEFIEVIGFQGSYINPRHIVLLVDFMVSLGQVSGITFTGISRQSSGALKKASFEKAMDTFKEAVGFGERKEIKETSASIYVGKKALIGTGYNDQFMDRSKFKDIEEEIDVNPDMKFDIGDTRDAIDQMTDLVFGADVMVMEGEEEEMFGGDESFLPGGIVMNGGNKTTDMRVFENIKGPLIRSNELTEVAIKLNNAPCLTGRQPDQIRVEDIGTLLDVHNLPTTGPQEAYLPQDTTPQLQPLTFTPNDMGLPEGLMKEMKQFQYMEPLKVSALPSTGLPSPIMPPLALEGIGGFAPKEKEKEKETTILFNLDDFLG